MIGRILCCLGFHKNHQWHSHIWFGHICEHPCDRCGA